MTLVPPPAPLPEVEFDGDEPTAAGVQAMETAAWAAKRVGLQIGVISSSTARAESVRTALAQAGIQARIVAGGEAGPVQLEWLTPGQTG